MRDVSPDSSNVNLDSTRSMPSEDSILIYFFYFLKSPLKRIQLYPDFPLHKVISLQIAFQFLILFISIITNELKIPFAVKVIALPLLIFIFHYLLCLMTRLFFEITDNKVLKFSRLWGLLFFCLIPTHIASIFAVYIPAISLIFFISSLFLLITGLVENFSVTKKRAITFAVVLFLFYLTIFIAQHNLIRM